MSDSSAIMSAKIDQQWQLDKLERSEVVSLFQALRDKIQAAADRGDTTARSWLNDLEGLTTQVRREQGEMESLLQLLHELATQPHHQPAGRQAAGQTQGAPSTGGGPDPYAVVPDVIHAAAPAHAADPYAVVPDVVHAAAPAHAADPYAVVPDVVHAAAPTASVDYAVVPDVIHPGAPALAIDYAVVMDHPNRNEPIPPWYTEGQAGSAHPVAPAAPPRAASEEEEPPAAR